MVKRIVPDDCGGLIIDVQSYFLSKLDRHVRSEILADTKNFVRLLAHFSIPTVVTLERPIRQKGRLPKEISGCLGGLSEIFEKTYFDVCEEKEIKDCLRRLAKRQVIMAGCETDVCVLQSCLGLLSLGYEVYVVEELIFSSARNVDSAIERMKAEGAIFMTYKSLYFELLGSVEGGRHAGKGPASFTIPPEPL